MTLDTTKPTDQVLVSEIPSYIRENRVGINAYEDAGGEVDITNLILDAGVNTMAIPDDLSVAKIETVMIDAAGAVNIETITGGVDGHIKKFVFQSSNVSFTDGSEADGKFYLNQLPAGQVFSGHKDDVLVLVNIGGGDANDGYWKELYRTLNVK